MNSFTTYRTLERRLQLSRFVYLKIVTARFGLEIMMLLLAGQGLYRVWYKPLLGPDEVILLCVMLFGLIALSHLNSAARRLVSTHSQKLLTCDWGAAQLALQRSTGLSRGEV